MPGSNGFGSAFDTILDELLEFFHECEQWVPIVGPVLEMLVEIPEGRELELFDLADYYGQAAQLHAEHAEEVRQQLGELYRVWQGDGGAQKTQDHLQKYLEQVNADAQTFGEMQKMVHGAALSVEAAKMMDVVNLVMLAMATLEVVLTIIETVGLSAVGEGLAIATCRQALKTALKELVEKLIGQGFKGAVKAALKAGLKRGLQFAMFTAGSKAGIMAVQAAEGHDPMANFDPIEFAGEVVDGFFAGFLGGPIAMGGHNPLTEAGAMALGQLGDNYLRLYRDDLFDAMGLTQWAKDHGLYVDRENFNPLDGVATAGLFGGVLGAKGMREGMRDAGADLRLKLGEQGALGDGKLGSPSRSDAGTGQSAPSETGGQRTSGEPGAEPSTPGESAGGSSSRASGEPSSRGETSGDASSHGSGEPSRGESAGDRSTRGETDPAGGSQEQGGGADRGGQLRVAEPETPNARAEPADRPASSENSADARPESTSGDGNRASAGPDRPASEQPGGTDRTAPEQSGGSERPSQESGTDRPSPERASDQGTRDSETEPATPDNAANGSQRAGSDRTARDGGPVDADRPAERGGGGERATPSDGAPVRDGSDAASSSGNGRHAEVGGPRNLERGESSSPDAAGAPQPVGAHSGGGEGGGRFGDGGARSDVRQTGFDRGVESDRGLDARTDAGPRDARPGSDAPARDGRGEEPRSDAPREERLDPTRDDRRDPTRDDRRESPRDSGNERRDPARDDRRDPLRDERGDGPRERPENRDNQKRWRDYAQRVQRWSENRTADQAAMDRAMARRFGPGEGGEPRLTPETVRKVLDAPADRLDATARRFQDMVRDNFTDPAFKDGQPIRRPSSPDDIAARLGELGTSRPPSLTHRLLNIDKLRELLPQLPREIPAADPIHSEHVVGGDYHGFGRPSDTVAVGREVRESVPGVLDRIFRDVEFERPDGGGPDVLRPGDGRGEIKAEFGAEPMDRRFVGTSTHAKHGDVWDVRANSGTRPEHVSTVTSHEIAEILHTERLRAAGEPAPTKNLLSPKDTGARELSPDDHGRIAEMLDWHERAAAGEPGAGERLGELIDHLGLRGDRPPAQAGRDAVTDLLDNPSAHDFNDAAAGRLSDLLKGPEQDLPAAPEPHTYTESDLRAIPKELADRLGIDEHPSFLADDKTLQMEANQQTPWKLRLHVEGDPANTFRIESGELYRYGHDGRTHYATDPFRKPEGWDVTNSKQALPDHPHDAAHEKQIAGETTNYQQHATDLDTATTDRAAKIDAVNAVLDAVEPNSSLPESKLERVTPKDLNSTNLDKTIERLREVAREHPEMKPMIKDLRDSARTWSETYNQRTLASNRVGMIAGREYAMSEYGIAPRELHGGVFDAPKSGELDIWGLGHDQEGNTTLVVVEAKGGGAGTEGREHLQQGSGPYLERVMQLDPNFQKFLRDNPVIAEQIRSGIIKVDYLLVSQPHADAAGVVPDARVTRFVFGTGHPNNIFDPRNIDAR
ncbi:hypothetical protein [Actinoplanes sp. L3-i22]|uniref:WXG100-like domain-containing protein n=1 Tax=Actinoplanes sp. L3-i22 TaxID=2836373 RepID=UPI001C74FCDE|nr:hypothetical protein [Actinoplanes sp. L3-i22]BCY11091.1 hypothetical protein L3i22_061790 [Actinoplanes sp. L3-i22]